MKNSSNLSVAVFLYNFSPSRVAYSGDRYHALLLAHALAESGARVSVVVDSLPVFRSDFAGITEGSLQYVVTEDYAPQAVEGSFDYVLVAPTGWFNPEFYNCAEQVAQRSGATPVLLNFESANWYESVARAPQRLRAWDYWRRLVSRGGVVLSSAMESDRFARSFYRADDGEIVFECCPPPINSVVADRASEASKDGSIVYFARPFHFHKGGDDVLALPPSVFEGRTFNVVFGGGIHAEYRKQLELLLASAAGARLECHSQINDERKFQLLARASALLFPSRFEGFGYPPVEAAYVGTEVACYDLPVLQETVGDIAHMAPVGDSGGLAQALERALAQPARRPQLRAAVEHRVAFDRVADRMAAAMADWGRRGARPSAVGRTAKDGFTVLWGPWTPEDVDGECQQSARTLPPVPPYGRAVRGTGSGEIVLSVTLWATAPVERCSLLSPSETPVEGVRIDQVPPRDGWSRVELTCHLSAGAVGKVFELRVFDRQGVPAHASQQLCVKKADHCV